MSNVEAKRRYDYLDYWEVLTIRVSKKQIVKVYSYIREMDGEIIAIEEIIESYLYDIIFSWKNREKLIEFLEKEDVLLLSKNGKIDFISLPSSS